MLTTANSAQIDIIIKITTTERSPFLARLTPNKTSLMNAWKKSAPAEENPRLLKVGLRPKNQVPKNANIDARKISIIYEAPPLVR